MSVRLLCLTFSILQQKKNGVFRDNELPKLHHVGHRMRHDGPLSLTTVTTPFQTLQQEGRERGKGEKFKKKMKHKKGAFKDERRKEKLT